MVWDELRKEKRVGLLKETMGHFDRQLHEHAQPKKLEHRQPQDHTSTPLSGRYAFGGALGKGSGGSVFLLLSAKGQVRPPQGWQPMSLVLKVAPWGD